MSDAREGRPRGGLAVEHALRYAATLGWPVLPGHWITPIGLCSCGDPYCQTPGAHPLRDDPGEATTIATRLAKAWAALPQAGVIAVTGRFEVIDVPALVGLASLEFLDKDPAAMGPVADGGGRIRFFIRPGAFDQLRGFAEWRRRGADIRHHRAGMWVPLPPTNRGTRHEFVWIVDPTRDRPWAGDRPSKALFPAAHLQNAVVLGLLTALPPDVGKP